MLSVCLLLCIRDSRKHYQPDATHPFNFTYEWYDDGAEAKITHKRTTRKKSRPLKKASRKFTKTAIGRLSYNNNICIMAFICDFYDDLCARAPPSIVWIQWEKQRDTFQLTFFCWSKAAIFLNEFQTRAIYACLLVCRDICDKQDRSSSEKNYSRQVFKS